ncbi:FAD binding domain protein [Diaporthe sp. PMI_573]|nr:FAD binding domain protein [Diaporthaceae sp. PMI_573]
MASRSNRNVVIVGAGPVGLFLAYRLGKAGVDVDVIEKEDAISQQPRSSGHYGAAALACKEAGLLGLMAERGHGNQDNPEKGMVIIAQPIFCQLVLEQGLATGHIRVHWGTELTGIDDGPDVVKATVRDVHSGTEKTMFSSFLVGADGGRSTTRKILGIQMQGHTWPERLVTTDVMLPHHPLHLTAQSHFVLDPVHYAIIVPLVKPVKGQPSLWRYTIAVDAADPRTDDEILSEGSLRALYEDKMVGPRPLQYEVKRKAMYRIHQRLATTMTKGRCVLAGDAAHLNNPFGAMGLTSGILDADALAETLLMIFDKQQPISLLNTYSGERRKVFQTFVDPTTTHNKHRIQRTPESAYEDWFLQKFKNPAQTTLEEFLVPFMTTWRTDMAALAKN